MNPKLQQNLFLSFIVFLVLSSLMIGTISFVHQQSVLAIEKEITQTLTQIGKVISTSVIYEDHLSFSKETLESPESYEKHIRKFKQIISENPDLFSVSTTIEDRNKYIFVLHSESEKRLTENATGNFQLISAAFQGTESRTEMPYGDSNIEVYIPLRHEGDVYAVLGLCMQLETYKGKIDTLNKSSGAILMASLLFCFVFSSLIVIIGNFKHNITESKKMHSEKL